MCLCMDGDSPEFFEQKVSKARKEYHCDECGEDIKKGTSYLRVTGKWDGYMDTLHICLVCDSWRTACEQAMKERMKEWCSPPLRMLWECIEMFCDEFLGYNPRRKLEAA